MIAVEAHTHSHTHLGTLFLGKKILGENFGPHFCPKKIKKLLHFISSIFTVRIQDLGFLMESGNTQAGCKSMYVTTLSHSLGLCRFLHLRLFVSNCICMR